MPEKKENVKFTFNPESLKKKLRPGEFIAEKVISGIAYLSIAIIILIFLFVFREAIPVFRSYKVHENKSVTGVSEKSGDQARQLKPEQYTSSADEVKPERYGIADTVTSSAGTEYIPPQPEESPLQTLTSKDWLPVSDHPRFGLAPLVVGTIKITIIAILFAAPISILAAIFSAAFAPKWLREIVKPAIELLAGFPSVVIGFFALMVMATFFQDLFGYDTRLNAFVGGFAMALAAIPIIFTLSEDMMTAVPSTYKEASLALGASRWQTAFFVTLPAALPGIFAAVLLGIGRIFGETMIALMATGNAAMMGLNPFESVRTLAATIGAEMAEVVFGDTHYSVLFLIGALLFIFTFIINAVAEFYIKGKLIKRFQGR